MGEVIRVKELSIAGTKRSLKSFLRPVMFSLKSFLRPRASETGLLMDASTRRSKTGLDPASSEMLVYVYSNSKMVAATSDADELKMFACQWDNEDV